MNKSNRQTYVVMEILKLVFFIVTYLLTASEYSTGDATNQVHTSFYNTLFIFSASTWMEYLSNFHSYDADRYIENSNALKPYNIWIYVFLSIYGMFSVLTMMYIVLCKDEECINIAIFIYIISAIYISIKTYIVMDILLEKIKKRI